MMNDGTNDTGPLSGREHGKGATGSTGGSVSGEEAVNITKDEARVVAHLVNAYSNAQTVVEQLRPVMDGFGLLKKNGALDADRVVKIVAKARG